MLEAGRLERGRATRAEELLYVGGGLSARFVRWLKCTLTKVHIQLSLDVLFLKLYSITIL